MCLFLRGKCKQMFTFVIDFQKNVTFEIIYLYLKKSCIQKTVQCYLKMSIMYIKNIQIAFGKKTMYLKNNVYLKNVTHIFKQSSTSI